MKRMLPILGIGTLVILLGVSPAAWGFADPPPSPCKRGDSNLLGDGRTVVLGQKKPKGSAITATVAFNIVGNPAGGDFINDTDLTIRVEKGGEDLFLRTRLEDDSETGNESFQYGTGDLIACRVLVEFGAAILDDLKLPAKRKIIVYTDEAFENFEPSLVGQISGTDTFTAITDLRFYVVQ